jgi:hypothetical protein
VVVLFVVVVVPLTVVVVPLGTVVVVVAWPEAVVVVVVADCESRNMALTVNWLGVEGMTFAGSKAMTTRIDGENLIVDGLFVKVGFF